MSIQHAVISDPNIHEPKGVAAATAGQVYVADGAGSGDWSLNHKEEVISVLIEDLAVNPSEAFLVFPYNVTINSAQSVLYDTINTADAVITMSIGGTPITGGAITIAFTDSAQGDVDSCTCTAANTLTAGTPLKFTVTGGAGGTGGNGHGAGGTSVGAMVVVKFTRT